MMVMRDSKTVLAALRASNKGFPVRTSEKVFFDAAKGDLVPRKAFVSWVDIMGASEKMEREIGACARDIGRFHAAILQAYNVNKKTEGISLHALVDGAYIVSEDGELLKRALKVMMKTLAETFLEASFENRFLVRAAVSWGEIIPSDVMAANLMAENTDPFSGVVSNVVLGSPFANAYHAERKAPPLGVYVHGSAIGENKFSESCVWKWWTGFDRDDWVEPLAKCLREHFEVLGRDYYRFGLPISKVDDYKAKVTSYFQRSDGVGA